MARLLAYLFADHHSGGGYPSRGIEDSRYSMEQIVEFALKEKPEWVISLGDAVNKAQTYADAVMPLKKQLRRLTDAGINVGFIDGNHDKRGTSWLGDDAFVHLDKHLVVLGKHLWMGLDFRAREEIHKELAGMSKEVSGLFMHQCWGDFIRFDGASQCDFADVRAPVKILATGDFHGGCFIEHYQGRDRQKILVCNPGSTSVQEIREPGDKYFVALYDNDRQPFGKVSLKTRVLLRPSVVNSQGELTALLGEVRAMVDEAYVLAQKRGLPEQLHKPLLHVNYSSTVADLPRRLEKVLDGKAHLFYSEIRPQKEVTSYVPNLNGSSGEAFTPLSLLSQEIDPDDPEQPLNRDAHALAELLYHQQDRASITKKVKEWLEAKTKGE